MKIHPLGSFVAAAFAGLFFLSGCGSSSTPIEPMSRTATALGAGPARFMAGTILAGETQIPTHLLSAVTGHLDAELRKRGLAGERDNNTIRIDATTTYYRMRSGFTRMAVGILAGKDGIECDVVLVDTKSGSPVGKFKVSSYNLTAVGGEDDVARMLAEEIAKAVEKYKNS